MFLWLPVGYGNNWILSTFVLFKQTLRNISIDFTVGEEVITAFPHNSRVHRGQLNSFKGMSYSKGVRGTVLQYINVIYFYFQLFVLL